MPELPEVETIKRDLAPQVAGKTITAVEFPPDPRCRILRRFCASKALFQKELQGVQILSLRRRAKYLVFDLIPAGSLIMHLGMSGQILLRPSGTPPDPYVRAIVYLDDEHEIRFSDPRKFGEILFSRPPQWNPPVNLDSLGPEPLEGECTISYLTAVLKKSHRPIKTVLMDQQIIAGIGNIYSDESLFAAALHPCREACSLSREEIARLHRALRHILRKAIKYRGTTARDQRYRDGLGRAGEFQNSLQVYQRFGQKCRRCSAQITALRIAGRTASFCPRCQK
ncbi:MAG TPA: bifunctional DNA-formamidopyrimidine glycosylase/DNA-(apurinic or apyrimidinic site) lyase [Thermodesulfobacteriota bacterium]|nr:bifunctional DNA-formamidopyrimidine glycosylase/DNA-(apurinic or apyrimidinic site) lyase [Deltaproteobacteria bacterium]HNR12499.1 bifunctional DNA-formamidopyrimidine glycosylase/DNA-(apurinic or apyrimidinic site) lyase [Thermodesulfobacteriota bacterium]HNU70493.1 bifunctional DNA-formamidopyrimidine glycosylase/DNA-(apurinic or apyrimidinic site) lyase [Thermodesulfobacteriota bacterium]HOC38589.1 bifunctional DNA-formamidopyrimidine glycosylase/DNA-(apurinic or apyrimidinic site) lyase